VQATIAGNSINGAGNNGIAMQNDAASTLQATLRDNTVTASAVSGLGLFSTNGANTVRVSALNNTFTNSGAADVLADYTLGSSSNVVLDFNLNTALPTGYLFQQAGAVSFGVVDLPTFTSRNIGPLNTTGTITNVPP
jgi:hypothetical protein